MNQWNHKGQISEDVYLSLGYSKAEVLRRRIQCDDLGQGRQVFLVATRLFPRTAQGILHRADSSLLGILVRSKR